MYMKSTLAFCLFSGFLALVSLSHTSCTQNVLFYEDTVHDWYKKVKTPKGDTVYEVTKTVTWTSPDKNENYGYWTAAYPWNKKNVIKASGRTITIYPGYAWSGMQVGGTSAKKVKPSLIHESLMYAHESKAPITRAQADEAFKEAMGQKLD